MPRPRNAVIEQRIATHHGQHATEAQISTALSREGHSISPSGVHRALARLGLAGPGKARSAPGRAAPRPEPKTRCEAPRVEPPKPRRGSGKAARQADTAAPVEAVDDDTSPTERLRRTLESLERAAKKAETDGDVGRLVQAQRAATQATALIAKLSPPPPPNLDDQPDMLAAAKRFRETVHALFDRVVDEATKAML